MEYYKGILYGLFSTGRNLIIYGYFMYTKQLYMFVRFHRLGVDL